MFDYFWVFVFGFGTGVFFLWGFMILVTATIKPHTRTDPPTKVLIEFSGDALTQLDRIRRLAEAKTPVHVIYNALNMYYYILVETGLGKKLMFVADDQDDEDVGSYVE